MKKISKLSFIFVAAIMILQVFIPVVSQAVLINDEYNTASNIALNIQKSRKQNASDTNETYSFEFNEADQNVFKIGEYKESSNLDIANTYYCLKWGIGFGSPDAVEYTDPTSGINYKYFGNFNQTEKLISLDLPASKLQWLVNEMYVPNYSNSAESAVLRNKLLANAGIEDSVLTDHDIDVVQQFVIWSLSHDQYALYARLSRSDFSLGKAFLKIDDAYYSDSETDQFTEKRASQIDDLYNYFVVTLKDIIYYDEHTSSNINIVSYGATVEETTLAGEDVYKIGPFSIEGNEDEAYYNLGISATYFPTRNGNVTELGPSDYKTYNSDLSSEISIDNNIINNGNFYVIVSKEGNRTISSFSLIADYSTYDTKATIWLKENETPDTLNSQPVLKLEKIKNNRNVSANVVADGVYDVSLRKFISKITRETERGEINVIIDPTREPDVYTETLLNGRTNESGETEYTATYVHPKNTVDVKKGDTIEYTIRIYNEGEIDAKPVKITDYLPEGLIFVEDSEKNQLYGWEASGQAISTNYLVTEGITIPAYNYYGGRIDNPDPEHIGFTNGLYYVDIPIVCKVSNNVNPGSVLRNIAAITEYDNEDRDSDSNTNPNINAYNPPEDNSTYQEDDDDYEQVQVVGEFDLALRKYITNVEREGENISIENSRNLNNIDKTDLLPTGSDTTAKYNHRKDPIVVETGDIVEYKIIIYNEGDIEGRANKIVDRIPEGLMFLDVEGNFVQEGNDITGDITLVRKENDNNYLTPYTGGNIDKEEIIVRCRVTSLPLDNDNLVLTNVAWIAEDEARDDDAYDRDSEPENLTNPTQEQLPNYKGNSSNDSELFHDDYFYKGQQDDDDFEKVVIRPVNFSYDILLRKIDKKSQKLDETSKFRVKEVTNLPDEDQVFDDSDIPMDINGSKKIVSGRSVNESNYMTPDVFIIEETEAPSGYCRFGGTIRLEVYKAFEDNRYIIDDVKVYVNNVEVRSGYFDDDISIMLTTEGEITISIKNYQLDLALRKYISGIERNEQNVEFDSREPEVDTTTLKNGIYNNKKNEWEYTATYTHDKNPLTVRREDVITYTIRIYNEGDIAGYASKITDYLPENLGFLYGYPGNENWDFSGNNSSDIDTMPYGDGNIEIVTAKNGKKLELVYNVSDNLPMDEKLIDKYDLANDELSYRDVEITCIVLAPSTYDGVLVNYAEISASKAVQIIDTNTYVTDIITDRDSTVDDIDLTDYDLLDENSTYQEDDDDYEQIQLQYFDLALRKFITEVNSEQITESREPVFKDENGQYIYDHSKEPVVVTDKDIVTYTIRVFNEGTISGYAEEIQDDIPEGLIFLPDDETNKTFRWKMYYRDRDDNLQETDDVTKAEVIRTDYLSQAVGTEAGRDNLIQAFDKANMASPNYKDVKISFKVSQADMGENNTEKIVINKAHITKDSDNDEDSTPDKWVETDDDQDIEKIRVLEFDLGLYKWVTQTIVTVDGKTTTTETGFKPNVGKTEGSESAYRSNSEEEPVAKVELDKKKLSKTSVKFVYNIKVVNEGDIAGYATEITDYIPEGLEFLEEDNASLWTIGEKDGTIVSRALEKVLLEPGKGAIIPVVFTWKNDAENFGVKVNIAAITEDYNDKNIKDIDSIPGNENLKNYKIEQEDDDDFALVILTAKTGAGIAIQYISLVLGFTAIIAAGVCLIKKFVL